MEFIKNQLINSVLEKYFETFAKTLDTADYVPAKYGKKIHAFIFKNMKRKFKEVNKVYKAQKKNASKSACEGASLRPSQAAADIK